MGIFWTMLAAALLCFGPAEPAAASSGPFRPTKEQWANLSVATVKSMAFRTTIQTDGNTAYDEDAETQVFSPYTGRVTRILAKPGDEVKQGEPLMFVAAAESVQARSDLLNARTQFDLAKAAEKRQHSLYLAKSGALKDWLQSQADLATAENNLRAAQEKLSILGISGSGKTASAPVMAPISGTVIQRQVGLGQYINSAAGGAASPVYTIGNLSKLWMIANVRESDAAKVRVGDPVEVRVPACPGKLYKARVTWVSPAIDPVSRRLPVRAEVENRDGKLKAMMFADFDIVVGKESAAPGVPQGAIVYEGDETRVYVAGSDGTIAMRRVKLGRTRHDGMVEVVSGLAPGERIVTGGSLFIDRAIRMKAEP